MSGIHLHLLGPVEVERDGEPIQGFESQKALALLCYLALHSHPLPRSHLAALFWGDRPEARSRGNLRRALSNLTSLLPGCLEINRYTARFRHVPEHVLDVTRFDALVVQGDPASLAAAAALYRGELLAGLDLPDCPEFETWLVIEREHWHQRASQVLDRLVSYYTRRGEYLQALEFASRLLALDPWREEAHRRKMLLLARTGQYSAALAQYETCCRILARELNVEPSPETTALYERIRAARSARRHNLPPQPTPFVGREEELRELRLLLANPECRLLTLIGPPGIGKTRLALQAAAQAGGHFLHGVCFVPLAALPSPAFLASAIAEALPFSLHGQDDPKEQLLNYLREKELLLVLDGFEHVLEGADLVVEILENAPDVKLLITSRERLHLRWEWLFEVEGLRYPDFEIRNPQSAIRDPQWSALQLFLQIARRTNPHVSLEDEVSHVVSICRLVEGMPLGIELAAAWVRRFPCEVIAREITHTLDFLSTSLQDMPGRHRSLRAAFDHSWSLLSEEERRAFRRLSVFQGGFREEAAQYVAGASPSLLSVLEDKSLLRRGVPDRYEMHDLLRQYAEEKLREVADEERRVRDRHCAHYAAFLHRREAWLEDMRQQEALSDIGKEIENLRAAWHWAVQWGRVEEIEKALGALFSFYQMRSWFKEGEEAFEQAAKRLREMAPQMREAVEKVLGRLLVRQGVFARALGWHEKGRALLEEGLTIARQLGDQRETALALNNLGILAGMRGDYAEEKRLFQESLSLYRALGDQRHAAVVLNNLACVERLVGAYGESRRLSEDSLTICRAVGHRLGMARALQNLALIAHCREEYGEAKGYYQESLLLFQEHGDRWGVALTLGNLGDLAYSQGDYAEAKRFLEESLALRRDIGDRWGIALALNTLGGVVRAMGHAQEARRYFREALEIALGIQSLSMVMEVLVESALLLAEERKGERALETLAFVLNHPATEARTRDRAKDLLMRLSSQWPSAVVAAAQERGKKRKLEEVVAGHR